MALYHTCFVVTFLVSQDSPYTLYYDGVANGVLSSNVNKHIHPGGALYIGVYPAHKNNLLTDGKL